MVAVQVRPLHRYLRDGLFRGVGEARVPGSSPKTRQDPCGDPAPGDQGGLHEVVPSEIRGSHSEQEDRGADVKGPRVR